MPQPRFVRLQAGHFTPAGRLSLCLDAEADDAAHEAATRLADELRIALRRPVVVERSASPPPASGRVTLRLEPGTSSEAYRLRISHDGVDLRAKGQAGLMYGMETLAQVARQGPERWPCLAVADQPAFARRGFYLDITRGKVPSLDTLKRLATRLARLKYNQLQLYVEHVFDFRFDPSIARGCDPLTARDILDLDAHCRRLHIELVPSLACFGHMGRILSLPPYRALAEIEFPAPSWEKATWRQRLRGSTINPHHPRAPDLFRRMLAEFLPLFSSPHFNICADETYDLGRGANAAQAAKQGVGRLYLDHLRFLHALAARHGKRLMFWGDILLHYPDLIPRIPRDCTVLDWGYEPTTRFSKVGQFIREGLAAYVCPATRGYGQVFNLTETARANIAGYARTGARLGAHGLLVTDWGDYGHFNMQAPSLHGMALAGALAWNPRGDSGRRFDRAFSLHEFGDASGDMGRLFREAGRTGVGSWPFFFSSFQEPADGIPTFRRAASVLRRATEWKSLLKKFRPSGIATAIDMKELELACEALALNAEKALLTLWKARSDAYIGKAASRFADHLVDFTRRYRSAWLRLNRPSELKDIERALRRVVREARAMARRAGSVTSRKRPGKAARWRAKGRRPTGS